MRHGVDRDLAFVASRTLRQRQLGVRVCPRRHTHTPTHTPAPLTDLPRPTRDTDRILDPAETQ